MKAAAFDYVRAKSIDEVCQVLAAPGHEIDPKIIAGGQTLVPLMAMRLARPSLLVDINDIEALQGIAVTDGALVIGSCTRQRAVEQSGDAARSLPLLAKALSFVGHQQTRNRGTIGGSLVHGDPSAEIPMVALALDARLHARSLRGERTYDAATFFDGPMITMLGADECLVEIGFPIWPGGRIGIGFHEVASRQGDFAIVAACAQVQLDEAGRCERVAVCVGGVAATPIRLRSLEHALIGGTLDAGSYAAVQDTIEPAIEPDSDLHGSAAYRRRVAGVLVGRAIDQARAEAAA